MSTLRHRLAEFEELFQSKTRPTAEQTGNCPKRGLLFAVRSAAETLRQLFTEGITRESLSELLRRETRETLQFFTRQVDFASLRRLPWFKRYPQALWNIFTYRLSPPRRIVFAVTAFSFAFGLMRMVGCKAQVRGSSTVYVDGSSGAGWWLVAIALFALLLLMELKDKLDLKSDLEVARQIQFGLVPSTPFQQGTIAIQCSMRPANTAGGDYYDIIDLGEGQIGIVIADVAGKGMPAALLMALLQASLHTLITAGLRRPELLAKLNAYLCKSIPAGSLVTLFYGEFDTSNGKIRYINAGHNPPFVIRHGFMRSKQLLKWLGETPLSFCYST